jgi:serine acetyltransferase
MVGIKYKRISRRKMIEIPKRTKIGYGLLIWHGHGIVINENTILGDNVMLTHNITFAFENGKAPVIGNGVRFAPGVVVVGGIKIGDHSVVGANTMVNKDIPSRSISMGVPNKILDIEFKENVERYFWRPGENT